MIEIPNPILSAVTSLLRPYKDFTIDGVDKMLNAPQMPQNAIGERFYSRKELSEMLKVSTLTIDRACKAKKLKHHQIGKRVLFSDLQVKEWLKRNTR